MKTTINLTEEELHLLIKAVESATWDAIQNPYDEVRSILIKAKDPYDEVRSILIKAKDPYDEVRSILIKAKDPYDEVRSILIKAKDVFRMDAL